MGSTSDFTTPKKRPAIIVPSNDSMDPMDTPTPIAKKPRVLSIQPKIDTIYEPKGKLPSNRTESIMKNLSIHEIEAKVYECKYIKACVDKRLTTVETYLEERRKRELLDQPTMPTCECEDIQKLKNREMEIKELKLELSAKNTLIETLKFDNRRLEEENRRQANRIDELQDLRNKLVCNPKLAMKYNKALRTIFAERDDLILDNDELEEVYNHIE